MDNEEKIQTVQKIQDYVKQLGSETEAANNLKLSTDQLTQILKGEKPVIKDNVWKSINAQLKIYEKSWQVVETTNFKNLRTLFQDAVDDSQVFAVINFAGSGKTETAKAFVENTPNTYLLQCNEYWNRKYFLAELLNVLGRDSGGLTVAEMMSEAVRILKKNKKPGIILDEADKLSDQVLYFFISLYNQLEDHCAIILMATDHLEKRIKRGLKLNKKGYKEIFSRIGRRFIEFGGITASDVASICIANGIENKCRIKEIWQDSEGDLRRVKRKIYALKKINKEIK
ncbi:ATP-binding protein [Apibacter sp. B3706]|uniref:AAA family ATPase n=1 Tax=Apibacter sp. B3706 TaxID=2656760 RepID=UPI00140D4785|nr:AAA family ATPase [Apibacter sp. B3706]QII70208.1 ATP-binding protein [Apibacter sp. B3706]